jgi:integrase
MSKYDSLNFWMQTLANRSPYTRNSYRQHFQRFTTWINQSPDTLFDLQHQARQQNGDHADPRDGYMMEQQVKQYITHLAAKDLSISYQKLSYAAINSFFKMNHVPLRLDDHDKPRGDNMGGSRIPSRDEIQSMIRAAITDDGKPRVLYQALVMFLKDSGLRLSDAQQVTWSGVQDLGDGFWTWRIMTSKRKVRALPIVGPETTTLLQQVPRKNEYIFPLKRSTISTKLCELTKGIDGVSPHGLRKFFYATLIGAKVPEAYVKLLMGKKVSAYDENRVEHLRARVHFSTAFMQAYDSLRIYEPQASRNEVLQLQQQVTELQRQLQEIQTSRAETDDLMDQLIRDPEYMALVRRKIRELSM